MQENVAPAIIEAKHKYSNRCKICFNTHLDVRPNMNKILQSTICPECSRNRMSDIEWYHRVRAKMDKFNSIQINLGKNFAEYEKTIRTIEFEDPFFTDMYEFIFDTFEAQKKPSCRTPVTSEELIAIQKYTFTKKLKDDEGSIPNLFGRMSFAFKIVSTQERKSLIYKDEFGKTRDIERSKVDTYEGWHGEIVAISGPYLCTYDQKVLIALLKIHHYSKNEGVFLKTSLRQIAEMMKMTCGNNNLKAIKSSINRLSLSKLNVSVLKGYTYSDGFFSGGYEEYQGIVLIRWSEYLLAHYRRNQYAILSLSAIFNLSDHAQLIYSFLMTHEDNYKYISLEKWKKILGREHILDKYFKRDFKKALSTLILRKLIETKSYLDLNNIVHTYLVRNNEPNLKSIQ